MEEIFSNIYERCIWDNDENGNGTSGPGGFAKKFKEI